MKLTDAQLRHCLTDNWSTLNERLLAEELLVARRLLRKIALLPGPQETQVEEFLETFDGGNGD